MLRIDDSSFSSRPASGGNRAAAALQADLLTRATQPEPMDVLLTGGLAAFASPSKKDLINLLKGRSPQELATMRKLYQAQNGVSLDQVIDCHFGSHDRVQLHAMAHHGKLRNSDALEGALLDDQNDQIHRLLKRRTARELNGLRREYQSSYGKDLDAQVLKTLEGKDREMAQVLLAGEPETRPGESRSSLARRQGDYVSKQLEIALRSETQPSVMGPMPVPVKGKRVLDALHDHSPEALAEAGRLYKERTGKDLREALKDGLRGADEDIALAYLNDGRETPVEKLRRAFSGNNDEELIRRTLRDLTPEQRRELGGKHGKEVARLFSELNSEELVEMRALLGKGQLGNADRLAMAVADGGDKGIVRALKSMTPQERQALAKDPARLSATLKELDEDEQAEVKRMLSTGRMSAVAELRHAETSEEVYRAASWAKRTGETDQLRGKVGRTPMGLPLHKVEVSLERFQAHLEKGELAPAERICLENNEDRLKATLRSLSAKELNEIGSSSSAMRRLDDELGKSSMAEARDLIARGPLPAHVAMRHAALQDDEPRIKELLAGMQDDRQRTELISKYRAGYRSELINDLGETLSGDDLRKADNALRTRPTSEKEVSRRVRDDMFADRDDNGFFSSVSNGLLDTFSSAGKNMDDQARETEALTRDQRRHGGHGLKELQAKEASFQDSREQMHVERQKVASYAVSAVTTVLTTGLGALSMSSGIVGQLLRTSWMARGAAVGGAVGARWTAEKMFRGNDFGTAQDFRESGISTGVETAAALTGGVLGKAVAGNQAGTAGKVTASVVESTWEKGWSLAANPQLRNAATDPAGSLLLASLGAGLAGGAATRVAAFFPQKKVVGFLAGRATNGAVGVGASQLRESLETHAVDELR